MRKFYATVAVVATFFCASAQSVALDPAFGTNGIATTQISSQRNTMNATAVQADGKVLVAGQVGGDSVKNMGVTRFNPDGTVETTFGTNGQLIINFPNAQSFVRKIAIQPDGKIILGGYTFNTSFSGDFVAVRLNPDGSYDSSFGNNGIAVLDNGQSEVSIAMTLLSDGRIILAGDVNDRFAMAMLKSNGTIDTTFGNNGWVVTNFDEGGIAYANDVAVQNDGKIVLGGMLMVDSPFFRYAAIRYLPNGTLDTSFANNGKFLYAFGGNNDFGINIGFQNDGKLIFAGHSYFHNIPYLQYDVVSLRLTTAGQIDTSYGQNGLAKARFVDGENYTSAIKVLPDDKIIFVGNTVLQGTKRRGYVARFLPNGAVDQSFGNHGFIELAKGERTLQASSVATAANGDIIAAGEIFGAANGSTDAFAAKLIHSNLAVSDVNTTKMNVFPNPASDIITISGFGKSKDTKAEIVNLAGQKVKSVTISENNTVNVSSLTPGVYILKVNSTTIKFIKK